nr:MAG TPA: hypothetical protein [Caudoviricetes sp.]
MVRTQHRVSAGKRYHMHTHSCFQLCQYNILSLCCFKFWTNDNARASTPSHYLITGGIVL